MLKKRLIGVITVKDNLAVQSIGYNRYLPLGKPQYLAENLDRFGVDEILILCIDRSHQNLGPHLQLLKTISSMGLSTPIAYGGGIHSVEQAISAIQSGAERLCVDAVLHQRHCDLIRDISQVIGSQALIAAMPVRLEGDNLLWYNYLTQQKKLLTEESLSSFAIDYISEILVIDFQHEGYPNMFDMNLVHYFPTQKISLIPFGGVSEPEQLDLLLMKENVSAVGVGNFLNYKEHAVQTLKSQLTQVSLREASYAAWSEHGWR